MDFRRAVLSMSFVFMSGLVLSTSSAFAQDCDSSFRPVQTSTPNTSEPMVILETSLAALKQEQADVRNRVWLPKQIEEIRQKGRIELESAERAIKYYRGLLVWKMRVLEQEVQLRRDKAVFEDYRSRWPANTHIDGLNGGSNVALFVHAKSFHAASGLTRDVFGVSEPTAEQVAGVMHMTSQLRGMKRRLAAIDRVKFERELLEPLAKLFSDVSTVRLETLERAVFVEPKEKITCCGSGRCDTCTHPNVVFRDMSRWPGPTHRDAEPTSTLPLYRVMDRLKQEFPDENFGRGFWDAAVALGH